MRKQRTGKISIVLCISFLLSYLLYFTFYVFIFVPVFVSDYNEVRSVCAF